MWSPPLPSLSQVNNDYEDIMNHRDILQDKKHCPTCTCEKEEDENSSQLDDQETTTTMTTTTTTATTTTHPPSYPCGQQKPQPETTTIPPQLLPPPLPEPSYSVHKRVLPNHLVALTCPKGKTMLLESLQNQTAESYWNLMNHFCNQSHPAYCGITTLLICLNSMSVDPNIRWRGGWRYYGDEDTVLQRCCIPRQRIERVGITLMEFERLAKCQGLQVMTKQPNIVVDTTTTTTATTANDQTKNNHKYHTVDEFRRDVLEILSNNNSNNDNNAGLIVASFARSALGQTGEGHFSPLAAYHQETDSVLVLDVARFKYAPYWVSILELYQAMMPLDETSLEPRGWFVLYPPSNNKMTSHALQTQGEKRRPAHLVPETQDADVCPVGKIKVHYCEASKPRAKR